MRQPLRNLRSSRIEFRECCIPSGRYILLIRHSQPKSAAAKPKPATETKDKSKAAEKGKGRRGRAARGRGGARTGRVKKSAEELDAEMVDYFADPSTQNGEAMEADN